MHNKIKFFLNYVEEANKNKVSLKKVCYRPNKFRSFVGFSITGIFLFLLLFVLGFQLSFIYLILLTGSLILFLYYAINLFGKEGIYIIKYVDDCEKNGECK